MDYKAMPTIRLEVESMKHAILTHIGANNSELGAALNTEIEKALASYDWQGQVTEIVHKAITERIAAHFTFGAGRDAVQEAVAEGFNVALKKGRE